MACQVKLLLLASEKNKKKIRGVLCGNLLAHNEAILSMFKKPTQDYHNSIKLEKKGSCNNVTFFHCNLCPHKTKKAPFRSK